MLNRHAIVLYLGVFALQVIGEWPDTAVGFGWPFLALLVGLLLDQGSERARRQLLAHGVQAIGVAGFLAGGALSLAGARPDIGLAVLGIGVISLGVLAEQRVAYRRLKAAIAVHALGDLLFLAGFCIAPHFLKPNVRAVGWVFVAIASVLSLYAVIANVVLQIGRLRNLQAGWRFRVLGLEPDAMRVKTPSGEARVPWKLVEEARALDGRHLLLVLPSPLPAALKAAGLPLEELRQAAEATAGEGGPPPEKYGFILHEQELGRPVSAAAEEVNSRSLRVRAAAQLHSP